MPAKHMQLLLFPFLGSPNSYDSADPEDQKMIQSDSDTALQAFKLFGLSKYYGINM